MHNLSLGARPTVQNLRASKIREVANAGMGREDVLAFWFGEPDEVTPDFIRKAGMDAIAAGDVTGDGRADIVTCWDSAL